MQESCHIRHRAGPVTQPPSGGIRIASSGSAPAAAIGGSSASEPNYLDDNTPNNIEVDGSAKATIRNNQIFGANANGSSSGPNIRIFSTGEIDILENTIVNAAGAGVEISNENSRTEILPSNSWGPNNGLGIDLGGDGPSCGGGDSDPPTENGGITCPVINSANATSGAISISYNASKCSPCRIDVYRANPNASGDFHGDHSHGRIDSFLGSVNASGGGATFNCTGGCSLCVGNLVTATANDTDDNRTSELARNRAATGTGGGGGDTFKIDGIIGGDGNNDFGGQGSGAGGEATITIKKRNSNTAQVVLRVCNDGTATDGFQITWNETGNVDFGVGGDPTSPATFINIPGGECLNFDIDVDATDAAPRKKPYETIFDIKSTNANVYDSVRLLVRIKK